MWSAQSVPTITSPSRTGPSAQEGVGIAAACWASEAVAPSARGATATTAGATASITTTLPGSRPIPPRYPPGPSRCGRPSLSRRPAVLLRRRLAFPVLDLRVEVEEGVQAAALRQALAGADLVRVGIDDDVRGAVGGDAEEADLLLGRVEDLGG